MSGLKTAVIGGTGFYGHPLLEEQRELEVKTGYGTVRLLRGSYRGREIFFLARHGAGHSVPPHLVNYRANIAALRRLGAGAVIATAAAGSLRRTLAPGSRVVIDQFIDFTRSRPSTFFDGAAGKVVHVDLTEPYCPAVRAAILRAGESLGERLVDGGCYLCTEGPRFETPAEIRMFAGWGADLVGMTNVPEVILAREAGLCYAALALVSNYAAGISPEPLTYEEVLETVDRDRTTLEKLLLESALAIEERRTCSCAAANKYWPREEGAEP